MISDPAPRCQNETVKKVRTGFGITLDANLVGCMPPDDCQNAEIEDCKAYCLNDKRCISIQYCSEDKTCEMYDAAPSKDGRAALNCNIYVKSCGNLNDKQEYFSLYLQNFQIQFSTFEP